VNVENAPTKKYFRYSVCAHCIDHFYGDSFFTSLTRSIRKKQVAFSMLPVFIC